MDGLLGRPFWDRPPVPARPYVIRALEWEELPLAAELRKRTCAYVTGAHALETLWILDHKGFLAVVNDRGAYFNAIVSMGSIIDLTGHEAGPIEKRREGRREQLWSQLDRKTFLLRRSVRYLRLYADGCEPCSTELRPRKTRVQTARHGAGTGQGCLGLRWQSQRLHDHGQRVSQELYMFRSALPFVSRFALQQVGGPSVLDVEGEPDVPSVMFVRDYDNDVLDAIIRYDMEVTRLLRPRYVQLTLEEETSVVKVAVRKQTGIVCGFGVIQEELRGRSAVLRHVYAENIHVAKILIHYLVTEFPLARSKGVQLLVPVVQDQSWTLLEDFGVPRGSQYPVAHLCFSRKEVELDYRRMYVF